MAYSTYMHKAYIFRLNDRDVKKNGGLFDLEKFFRDLAARMGIAHRDPCCDVGDTYPVRANSALDGLEYFDPADKTWKELTLA